VARQAGGLRRRSAARPHDTARADASAVAAHPDLCAATYPGSSRPLQRAARYDGVFPIPPDPMNDFISVDDVRTIRDAIGRDDGFDLAVNAGPDGAPDAFARAGVTWWIETYFTRADALRRAREAPSTA
jgi:hypothetical protein